MTAEKTTDKGLHEATTAELAEELASRGAKVTTLAEGASATLSQRGPATILVVAGE